MTDSLRWMFLLAAYVVLAPMAFATGLEGSQVSATAYCCSAPVESNRLTETISSTIGPGVEFLAGSLPSVTGVSIITSNIDFSAERFELTYITTATSALGTFNGLVFEFSGLPAIQISGVSLNPLSSFRSSEVGLAFDSDTVSLSLPGLAFMPGTKVVVDMTLIAVPEPDEWVMLFVGLGLVSYAVRRRNRA